MVTGANRIIRVLQDAGVQRLFGMPGGGSNADLIEAAADAGLPFSLAQAETASAFMAGAQAEITGRAGACLATLGPGASSLTNGVANASLDRIPLIIMTDCYGAETAAVMRHQALQNREIFRSLVKCSAQLSVANISEVMRHVLEATSTPPLGPVHLDVSQEVASAPIVADEEEGKSVPSVASLPAPQLIPEKIRVILAGARHPVFLIGLGARTTPIARAIRSVSEQFGIPALVTYKAKGVVPDRHPWFGGVFMNGALERKVLERADLFLAVGLDVVEILPVPWKFSQPVISITSWPMKQEHIPLLAELVGDVASLLLTVAGLLQKSDWIEDELLRMVELQRHSMRPGTDDGALAPHRVVDLVAEAYPGVRATVDAGAHMLPIMALWPANDPCDVLISNGLSTMGFAVPAAIGAAFLDRPRPTLAFTGDGGLLMCLGELRTAARENLPLRVIVFDDGELSLIKFKQLRRGYRTDGVTIGEVDWRAVASGLGMQATQADDEKTLRDCLRDTLHHPGPVLISAKVGDRTYQDAIREVRG
jgi:acetolactate synthase-1/2/3 large subunit